MQWVHGGVGKMGAAFRSFVPIGPESVFLDERYGASGGVSYFAIFFL